MKTGEIDARCAVQPRVDPDLARGRVRIRAASLRRPFPR